MEWVTERVPTDRVCKRLDISGRLDQFSKLDLVF